MTLSKHGKQADKGQDMKSFKVIINNEYITWVGANSPCVAGQKGIDNYVEWYDISTIRSVEVFPA